MFAPRVGPAAMTAADTLTGSPALRRRQPAAPNAPGAIRRPRPSLAWDFTRLPAVSAERPRPAAQTELTIGTVDDPLESEADRVADHIMQSGGAAPAVTPAPAQISRKCATCEDEPKGTVQMKAAGPAQPAGLAPPAVHQALRASGQPLAPSTRTQMERHFRHDFSRVRIHADTTAGASARAINAKAYTAGNDIVFAPQMYAPESPAGRRLLAHELTHVVQQSGQARPVVQRTLDRIAQSGCNFTFELGIGIYGPRATPALAARWQNIINTNWTRDLVCASDGNRCFVAMHATVTAHPQANWLWQVPESNPVYVEGEGYRDRSAPLYKHWAVDADDLTVTHETGHLMGLLDKYIGNYSLIPNDIMANYFVDRGPTQYSRALGVILADHNMRCDCCRDGGSRGGVVNQAIQDAAAEAYRHSAEAQGDQFPPGSERAVDDLAGPPVF